MKQHMKSELYEMYHSIFTQPKDDAKYTLIQNIQKSRYPIQNETSILWFIKSQIKFISAKTWLLQFLLILLYGTFVSLSLKNMEGFLLLVPTAPLAVFIGTSELSRSYRFSMAEIELPTRFSLRKVIFARLCLTAAFNLCTFTFLLIFTVWKTYAPIGYLILYGIVPCAVASFGCLVIMNRCKTALSQYYTAMYCIALSVQGTVSITQWPCWYETSANLVWLLVFVISLAGCIKEIYKMWHDCINLETING